MASLPAFQWVETSEGSPKNITPCLHRSNSVAQFTLESRLWLKMEAALLILTLVVISIPIVALTVVIVFLPLARKRFTSFVNTNIISITKTFWYVFFQESLGFWLSRKKKWSLGARHEDHDWCQAQAIFQLKWLNMISKMTTMTMMPWSEMRLLQIQLSDKPVLTRS